MKVIKRGRDPGPPTWRVTCGSCKSVLEYTQQDIQGDFRDGDYIVCPTCKAWINCSLGVRADKAGAGDAEAYYNK